MVTRRAAYDLKDCSPTVFWHLKYKAERSLGLVSLINRAFVLNIGWELRGTLPVIFFGIK